MKLFLLFNIINLFGIVNSSFIRCRHFDTMKTCIKEDLCKWCNISTDYTINNVTKFNTTGTCKYATSYVLDSNDQCIYSENYEYIVGIINIIINVTLIVIFLVLLTYIVGVSELILNKYFDSSNNNSNERMKEKSVLVTIISFTVFTPAIIFMLIQFKYFMIYFLFMLFLTVFINCSINTHKIYNYNKENEKKSYESI